MAAIIRITKTIGTHGTFVFDSDLFESARLRTKVDLYREVREGSPEVTGWSKLRKDELAVVVADWATGTRDNERDAAGDDADFNALVDEVDPTSTLREREARTPAVPDLAPVLDDAAAERLWNATFPSDEDVSKVFHLIVVRFLAGDDQLFRVEGTTPGPSGTLVWLTPVGDDLMPARPSFPVAAHRLFKADVTACCHHGYTVNDSCPNCDAEDDEDGQTGRDVGRHALLTELGFATMVERRPDADGPGMRVMPVDARDATYLETRR